jgi:hypothetical protein
LQELFAAAEQSWGRNPAEVLMEMLSPAGWGDVARRADLDAHTVALRGDLAQVRGELTADMAELRVELKDEMTGLRVEMAELRVELKGDIARLEARIDGLLPRQLLADVPLAFAVAALVLAAARLA